jgi:hypothetical protein
MTRKIVDSDDFEDADEFHDALMTEELSNINVINSVESNDASEKEYVTQRIVHLLVVKLKDDGTPADTE